MTHEPAPIAILAARIMRAYPSLSPYSAASLATELSAIERAQRRHAERCCSGADGGYVKARPGIVSGSIGANARNALCHDPEAEERAGKRIERMVGRWRDRLCTLAAPSEGGEGYTHAMRQAMVNDNSRVTLEGDPRGPVLKVQFPGESEPVGVWP